MLNPEFKAKWLTALHSGEYIQGSRKLRYQTENSETRHCCVGVAFDICGLDWGRLNTNITSWPLLHREYSDDWETAFSKATGLTKEQCCELADANDAGASFEDIAKRIETL